MNILNQKLTMPQFESKDIKEFFSLLWVNFKVSYRNFWEYLKVVAFYYTNISFFKSDFGIVLTYLFDNPFTISKRFLMKRGEKDLYQYGETPLVTLDRIMSECGVTEEDTIYELGCGRGRTCFWLSEVLKAKVVGIEYIPEFVTRANRIKRKVGIVNATFINQNMLDADLSAATVIYLYGTCYEDAFIEKVAERLSHLPSGTKIITTSYSLTDYVDSKYFEVMKCFPANFTWGEGDVYLQIVK